MAESLSVLLVDDELSIRRMLGNELRNAGLMVETAENADAARVWLAENSPDVIVLDLRMPGTSGNDFLRELRTIAESVPVIILTGHADVDLAVQCMKDGAMDLLTKPCSVDHLELAIRKASEMTKLREANKALLRSVRPTRSRSRLIGGSQRMVKLRTLIQRVASTDEPVLIIGESGTGKELIAQEIQSGSERRSTPFIAVNCAAVSETLLESELFGHEKGAFSGATERRPGYFELADKGTIFLDEIGDMPILMQPKLLRVLQSGEFRRVGGGKTLSADVRLICATNKTLPEEVREGRFREDLMHRINTIVIEAPALRDHLEDLDELIDAFRAELSQPYQAIKLLPETMDVLRRYHWPGNIRELRNVVRRAAILSETGEIVPEDLPAHLLQSRLSTSLPEPVGDEINMPLADIEKRHILSVLKACDGNKTQAARRLGVSIKTLYNKLDAWSLEADATEE